MTAEIVSQDDKETKLKAQGTVDGRTCVSGRLVLARYNLADSDPQGSLDDETIVAELRQMYKLLNRSASSIPQTQA